MSKTFEAGKEEIARLCQHFETNRQRYLGPGIKEAHVRQSLIDPFFEALGWDVRNQAMTAPQYREVIPEDSLEIEGQQKAPDYTFRVGMTPKFYTEAKRCNVNIREDAGPAYQLRRYGWSAKVALSLLTDFEELAVYDCSQRPRPSDKAGYARIQYYTYREYPDRWREIWDVFSREAIWSGAFDQYAASKRKRGTSEVDTEFLKEIESWRNDLARNIALRNPALSSDELNAAVQRTIDRIVFLRMAEDRGLERFGQLLRLCEEPDMYTRFMHELCRHADAKYNSGIFHFQQESGVNETPDTLTPQLKIDDKVFKPILQRLYFEHGSPYHFGVIPVEILGTVYERFLGKVIRLTPGHQAKVEEKPEVRKAGGVYYTPAYIVDYIVNQTLGKQIEGKSPAQLAGAKKGSPLRILDMACGSGSFLLGAYQKLLDHCLAWYLEHRPQTQKKALCRNPKNDQWQLSIEEKKRLLLTHIFGVDIDPQAVEVTKLSLLLKALESESDATLAQQLQLFHTRALPNLAGNIQCGNSLIGPDYFDGDLITDPDEIKRINPFDWHQAFPQAMKDGGFDCVIGNPPYVRQETMGTAFKEYVGKRYEVYHGIADLYVYFMEKGVSLIRPGGRFSYIVANKWMRANYGEPLRRWLSTQKMEEIIDFGDLPVFKGATTYPCIIRIQKVEKGDLSGESNFSVALMDNLNFVDLEEYAANRRFVISRRTLDNKGWSLANPQKQALLEKIRNAGVPLGEYLDGKIYYGIKTGLNEAFVIDRATRDHLIAEDPKSEALIKPFLAGRDIKRYMPPESKRFLIFTRRGTDIRCYPAIEKHLLQYKKKLTPRPSNWKGDQWPGRKPGTYKWFEIQDTIDYHEEFEKPKIIVPSIVKRASYTYDTLGYYSNDKTSIIPTNDLSLIAILSSKLVDYFMHEIASTKQGGYYEYKPMYLAQLPIRPLSSENPSDKKNKQELVVHVDRILSLHKQLMNAREEKQKTIIQYQIDSSEDQIDHLVYRIYGLTDEEISIVEGAIV